MSLRRQSKEEWNNLGSRIYEKTIENYLQTAEKRPEINMDKPGDKKDPNETNTTWWQKHSNEAQQPYGRTRRRWIDDVNIRGGVAAVRM